MDSHDKQTTISSISLSLLHFSVLRFRARMRQTCCTWGVGVDIYTAPSYTGYRLFQRNKELSLWAWVAMQPSDLCLSLKKQYLVRYGKRTLCSFYWRREENTLTPECLWGPQGNLDYAGSALLYGLCCINLVCFDEIKISCQRKKGKRKIVAREIDCYCLCVKWIYLYNITLYLWYDRGYNQDYNQTDTRFLRLIWCQRVQNAILINRPTFTRQTIVTKISTQDILRFNNEQRIF